MLLGAAAGAHNVAGEKSNALQNRNNCCACQPCRFGRMLQRAVQIAPDDALAHGGGSLFAPAGRPESLQKLIRGFASDKVGVHPAAELWDMEVDRLDTTGHFGPIVAWRLVQEAGVVRVVCWTEH